MRSTILIGILATLAGLAVLPAIAEDSEAMEPAEIDFFINGVCVEQWHTLPGRPLNGLPDLPTWAAGWATAEGDIVTETSTFGPGSHVVIAYVGQHPTPLPPTPEPAPAKDNTGTILGAVGIGLAVVAVGISVYGIRRK